MECDSNKAFQLQKLYSSREKRGRERESARSVISSYNKLFFLIEHAR